MKSYKEESMSARIAIFVWVPVFECVKTGIRKD